MLELKSEWLPYIRGAFGVWDEILGKVDIAAGFWISFITYNVFNMYDFNLSNSSSLLFSSADSLVSIAWTLARFKDWGSTSNLVQLLYFSSSDLFYSSISSIRISKSRRYLELIDLIWLKELSFFSTICFRSFTKSSYVSLIWTSRWFILCSNNFYNSFSFFFAFSFAIFSTLRTIASKLSMDDLQKPSTWSILDLKSFLTSRRDAIASSLLTSIKRACFFKEAVCLLSYQ